VGEKVTWPNPAKGSDHPGLSVVVCRRGTGAGWEVAAVQTDEFSALTITSSGGTNYVLSTRGRGIGVNCSGAVYNLAFKLIRALPSQPASATKPASWNLDAGGLEGYGVVTCRVAGLVDAGVFAIEQDEVKDFGRRR
jgi:hypothetical protein